MEKTLNRENYVDGFLEFLKLVVINEDFIRLIGEHEEFKHHLKNIKGSKSDDLKKYYIFLELTRERGSCDSIIEILEQSNQLEAAEVLKKYNKSPGLINILNASSKIDIGVNKRKAPKDGWFPTNSYFMFKNPRGKFIIINNLPKKVHREPKRFEHVFTELFFETKILESINVKQIVEKLVEISRDKGLNKDEAFGLMVITHGQDEKILGFDACEELEKPAHLRDLKIIEDDRIEFCDLIKIFTENCKNLNKKPKIFIFDCCRDKSEKPLVDKNKIEQSLKSLEETAFNSQLVEKYRGNWDNLNTDTFIIHSCSEGYYSWYWNGITAFGQAFSHAIARYAIDESLQSIMGRTCTLMELFKKRMVNEDSQQSVFSAPESKFQCTERLLFFNPGVEKNSGKVQKSTQK